VLNLGQGSSLWEERAALKGKIVLLVALLAAKDLRRRDGTAGCAVSSQRLKNEFQLSLQGLCFVKSTSKATKAEIEDGRHC
jgi:hypothetical protein